METNYTEETLLGGFREVRDPRAPYNQKHRFLDILTITILATICGAGTWDEIEDWGNTNLECQHNHKRSICAQIIKNVRLPCAVKTFP